MTKLICSHGNADNKCMKIEIEDLAEAMCLNYEQGVRYVITYTQLANDVGFLGNQIKVEIPVLDFAENLKGFRDSDLISHGLIDETDYLQACHVMLDGIMKIAISKELNPDDVVIVIPSMTSMGVNE